MVKTTPKKEFLKWLEAHGLSRERVQELGIPEAWARLNKLRIGAARYPYAFEFTDMIKGIRSAQQLKKRLGAEAAFYENTFRADSNGRFRVRLKRLHKWPDGLKSYSLIAFECPPGKQIGYARFANRNKVFVMNVFQGKKGANAPAANKALGRPWFEVFMDRLIESYRPMHKMGVKLAMYESDRAGNLQKKIRDRYFSKRLRTRGRSLCRTTYLHPLSFQKKRVQRLLRP